MGAASSNPRTVTVNNDSPAGLIDISDDVVQRLSSGLTSKDRSDQQQSQQRTSENSVPATGTSGPSSYPNPPIPPSVMYQGELPLTSMQLRQEKERELRENDVYWTQRMKKLEAHIAATNEVLEEEYIEAEADVKKRFATSAVQQQLPPCQDLKAKVIECYRKHPNETLLCAEVVQQFTDCVNLHRIKLLQQRSAGEK